MAIKLKKLFNIIINILFFIKKNIRLKVWKVATSSESYLFLFNLKNFL